MVVDYEAAWIALAAYAASKTQHGREGLLVEMTRLADEHRVPAGELSRLLRLYSIEVERTREASHTDRAELVASSADGAAVHPSADGLLAGHHDPRGDHDAGSAGRNGRAEGRGGVAALTG